MCIYLSGKILFFLSSQRPSSQCQHLSPWLPSAHFGSCTLGDGKRQIELNVLWKCDSFQHAKHLMIPPLFCFSEWPPASSPSSYPSRCLADWDHHRHGDWGDDAHACMPVHKHAITLSRRRRNATGFLERAKLRRSVAPVVSCLFKEKTGAQIELSLGKSSSLSSLSAEMDGSGFPFHSVKCKPFLWVIPS